MKRLFILLLTTSMFFTLSCSKKKDNNSSSNNSNALMSATINSSGWSATGTSGFYQSNSLNVVGFASDQSSISLMIGSVTGPGTFTIDSTTSLSNSCSYTLGQSQGGTVFSTSNGGSGTVKVNAVSSTGASGTFQFTGKDSKGNTKNVTNGTFNVTY